MDHSPTDRRFGGLGRQGNYLPLEDFGSLPSSTPAPQETAEEFTSPSPSLASPRDLDEPGCFLVPPSDLDCRLAWKWEILSLVVSGLAIIATGIFCFIIGGTNQPAWSTSVYGLSLNAILSTFSLASKSGILFPLDEALGQLMWLAYADGKWPLADTELYNHASRGPWGAVQLLSKRGHRGITSLGGILMILSVALAVTQQQLINYRTHIDNTVDDPLNLTLVATSGHIYDSVQQASDEKDGPIQPVVEFAVSAEVFSSLNHYVVHDPLYRCDSGNCQYPVFTTLGICSDCSMNRTANYACDGDNDMCEAEYDGLTSISYKENSGDVEYRSTIVNQTAKMDDPDLSIIVRTWTLMLSGA
ncbi:hypothetical protein FPQ18DRAFT_404546 [Pyronema domesticum]|nr:hypothetical protein FPQ18DRAFT_404546 [Pyronema domesticum]